MTQKEAIIASAYTGIMFCKFEHFHQYAEEKLKRPIFTHEFASIKLMEELKDSAKEDFIKMCELINN